MTVRNFLLWSFCHRKHHCSRELELEGKGRANFLSWHTNWCPDEKEVLAAPFNLPEYLAS